MIKHLLNDSELGYLEQVIQTKDTSWLDTHEAKMDEEIRQYLAAHADDQFSDTAAYVLEKHKVALAALAK